MMEVYYYFMLAAGFIVSALLIKHLNGTDIPHIRGLLEAPGVALFENLLQFGDQHPRRTLEWAKKLGPVFQARLGNKVRAGDSLSPFPFLFRGGEENAVDADG
jgi:phenylacetate 2-hydroxylase